MANIKTTCDVTDCKEHATRPVLNEAGLRLAFACSREHSEQLVRY